MTIRIFVVVPTTGRAEIVRQTVERLSDQTRQPDGVMIVAVTGKDVEGIREDASVEIVFAERGLCRQRNQALELLDGRADIAVFLDDDFLPTRLFIEAVERLFNSHADIVGANGRIIADGVRGVGISFDEATRLVAADEPVPVHGQSLKPMEALYGCNMVVRLAACEGLRFDENLPLYGWQEDIDFTFQLGRRGRLVLCNEMAGVHLGTKAARTPGRRLGYSQIANPVYLLRKGTMPPRLGRRLIFQNLLANLFRSLSPEPYVDRRGRLLGNLLALRDLVTGKLDPRRILEL